MGLRYFTPAALFKCSIESENEPALMLNRDIIDKTPNLRFFGLHIVSKFCFPL